MVGESVNRGAAIGLDEGFDVGARVPTVGLGVGRDEGMSVGGALGPVVGPAVGIDVGFPAMQNPTIVQPPRPGYMPPGLTATRAALHLLTSHLYTSFLAPIPNDAKLSET